MTQTNWARKNLSVFVSACVSLATISLSAAGPESSHNSSLPPLKLLAPDLDIILQKAHSFIAAANGPPGPQNSIRESVTLGVGGREIEIPHFSVASSVAFPKTVFSFSYKYYDSDKPISSVTIDLRDYSRRVSITGEAADQVGAISNLIENNLRRHSTTIGGAMFRRVAGTCLSLALLASLIVSSAYCLKTGRYSSLGMPIFSALGLVLLFRLPWDRFLPGFALYQTYSPFFLVRYAPQIAVLSLLATLVAIPLSYFLPRWRGKA